MFGLTPYLILMDQVFKMHSKDQATNALISTFKKDYPQSKMFQPSDIAELESCISEINKSINI